MDGLYELVGYQVSDPDSPPAGSADGGPGIGAQSGARIAAGLAEPTDEQLLREYQGGDPEAFARLLDRYRHRLCHFLKRFTGSPGVAEDICQDTFLQVFRHCDQFDTEGRFRPWLFTIALNKARDLIKSQARHSFRRLRASQDPDRWARRDRLTEPPDVAIQRRETRCMVRQTLADMPCNMRQVLTLSHLDQLSHQQISQKLGIPIGTVKSRLHYAEAKFEDRWQRRRRRSVQLCFGTEHS